MRKWFVIPILMTLFFCSSCAKNNVVDLLSYPLEATPPQYVIDKRDSYKNGVKPGSWFVRSEIKHSNFSPEPLSVLDEAFVEAFGRNENGNSITVYAFNIYDMPYKTSGKSWPSGAAVISWILADGLYNAALKESDFVLCRFEGEFMGKPIAATTISEYKMDEGAVWSKFDLSQFRAALIDVVHDCISKVVKESKKRTTK